MAIHSALEPSESIAAGTTLGTVRLTVSDLASSRSFYELVLGMSAAERPDGALALGAVGSGQPLLELRGNSAADPMDHRRTGLYHFAILVPTRRDLAAALARLLRARWPLQGASDHLVSEALYLNDPDGNGIEIYRDRPRPEWPRAGERIRMATLPLDLDGLLGELAGGGERDAGAVAAEADPDGRVAGAPLPAAAQIGHVHLQVSDLRTSEAFYSGVLGFEVTVRGYPGALFVSAGGYHHHVGLNTWHSAGAAPPPPGALGLRSLEVLLPDTESLRRVLARVDASGLATERVDGGALVRDPSGNAVLLRA
jgi:catechol 2,3-dioxygenase